MRTDMAYKYADTLERAERHLFRMAFTEYHPEPLAYEEIQELFSEVSSLDIMKLYAEAVKAQTEKMLNVYESLFVDILTNPHNNDRANPKRPSVANDRMNLPPYYPAGTSIRSLKGNPVRYSMNDGKLICTETDKEGDAIAVNDVISYLFDGERIVKRLQDEGRDADYIIFFLSQVNQLQDGVLEALDFVRIMFDYLKNQHLKKYNGKTIDSLLSHKTSRAENKERNSVFSGVTKRGYYRTKDTYIALTKKDKTLADELSKTLKKGVDSGKLTEALEVCDLEGISNGNRLELLFYAFMTYAGLYVDIKDRDKYIADLTEQAQSIKPTFKATNTPSKDDQKSISQYFKF